MQLFKIGFAANYRRIIPQISKFALFGFSYLGAISGLSQADRQHGHGKTRYV
jgi:hypothetical protein